MSYSVDANLLLYAANAWAPEHERARRFLESCASRSELLCLTWPTVMAFLRISTHPRIFPSPLTWAQATSNIGALLTLPHVRMLEEGEDFWEGFLEVAVEARCTGNLTPDAHLAATLRHNGVAVLYTNDVDFRRFDFLEVRFPLRNRED